MSAPTRLSINAWTGRRSPETAVPSGAGWDVAIPERSRSRTMVKGLAPPSLPDLRDWRSERVGWGLVLPDDPALDSAAKSRADDAPEPLQALVAQRGGAPVLRWSPDMRVGHLQRYYPDGGGHSRSAAAAEFGVGPGQIPRYLLIYGKPDSIPWSVQYSLNMSCYVGRLTLEGAALERYVAALMGNWADGKASRSRAVVWSTDLGRDDITWLMSRAVGKALASRLADDPEITSRWMLGKDATGAGLARALVEGPGLVCTTSHGMTGPPEDPKALRAWLGAPVDQDGAVFNPGLLESSPGGTIWYSHACCSAGSDARSRYTDLFPQDDDVGATLRAVAAAAGARVAPLPETLLGGASPIRAFVGHVEPTFNWTLRDPVDNAVLTHTIVGCLYDRLFQADRPSPLGWALADTFSESARFYAEHNASKQDGATSTDPIEPLYRKLAAVDRQSLVLLGDPTVTLPANMGRDD